MSHKKQKPYNDVNIRQRAFSRWENEGGAPASGREKHPAKTLPAYKVVYKKKPIHTNIKGE